MTISMPARVLEALPPPRPSKSPRTPAPRVSWRDENDYDMDMHMTPVADSMPLDSDDEQYEYGDENGDHDENRENQPRDRRRVSFSRDTVFRRRSENSSDDENETDENGYSNNNSVNMSSGAVTLDEDSSDDEEPKEQAPEIHIEVCLADDCCMRQDNIISLVATLIGANYVYLSPGTIVAPSLWADIAALKHEVTRICIADTGRHDSMAVKGAVIKYHVYRNNPSGGLELGGDIDDRDMDDEDKTSPAMVYPLPSAGFDGLWDHLIYDDDIKPRLLKYISSSMLFSENKVDYNIISWNRMVLLHGPPGTGKTSLCRALAQKLAIRMSETFTSGRLVEINSHSLFSKWFSESGKLVHKLFEDVHAMIANEQCLVIVMIDEVESLTSSREASNEPSDALRVVNALLTQLDKLKAHKNVLVMTTSNLAGKIDPAFLDRADLKQFVGLPPAQAIYWMMASCLAELHAKGLAIGANNLLSWHEAALSTNPKSSKRAERGRLASRQLMELSVKCKDYGFSGRFLRKVPLMAHAKYLHNSPTRVDRWVDALGRAVEDERVSREILRMNES